MEVFQGLLNHQARALEVLQSFAWLITFSKNQLVPSQRLEYLGVSFDSDGEDISLNLDGPSSEDESFDINKTLYKDLDELSSPHSGLGLMAPQTPSVCFTAAVEQELSMSADNSFLFFCQESFDTVD